MQEQESEPGKPLPPVPGDAYPPDARPLRPTLIETPPTCDEALLCAARLLNAAEAETDRGLMERLETLADSWLGLAAIQRERERA